MKEQWLAQMARLDSLSLRERIFLALSILAVFAALADSLWLSPARMAHKQLQVRLEKQSAELQSVRDSLRANPLPVDANQGIRQQVQQTQDQIEQVNQSVRQLLPGSTQTAPLAQALVHLLRRQPGLSLVRTSALAPEAAGPGNNQGAASLPAGLTRQGVALAVTGPYADLTRYVAALEASMPNVRWGVMTLVAGKGQPEMTLQLFLLGEAAP